MMYRDSSKQCTIVDAKAFHLESHRNARVAHGYRCEQQYAASFHVIYLRIHTHPRMMEQEGKPRGEKGRKKKEKENRRNVKVFSSTSRIVDITET